MSLRQSAAWALLIGSLTGIAPAWAQHAPVIVVPGRRGVPVYINGHEASWAVVYGDWGLNRPGHMAPIVIRPQPWPHWRRTRRYHRARLHPGPAYTFQHYYPGGGLKPNAEQDEAPAGPPKPAQDYRRSWTTDSTRVPANVAPPTPVVIAPLITPRVPAKPKP